MYVCMLVFVGRHIVQALPFVYAFLYDNNNNNKYEYNNQVIIISDAINNKYEYNYFW